ncbi:MAG: bifunctional riboflavin kinase/FAD synthetase [Clostridia bacterium]|nr:bifunctional riboflavin kinase/FAD synthetase [Clostridia bacterium]
MFFNKRLSFIDLVSGEEHISPPCSLLLAIGNFDGVHLGHRKLIETAVCASAELSYGDERVESGVFCFSEPPADHLESDPPSHICSLESKLRMFKDLGARYAVVADFLQLKDLSEADFCRLLLEECACRGIVCGYNFRFGRDGVGNAETLKKTFCDNAFVIDAVASKDGVSISSSRIRALLIEGRIEEANELLGHPFAVCGEVVHGKALGRRLELPTLNQRFSEKALIPKKGIYASLVLFEGKRFAAVTNIGTRPTVEEQGNINCETHLLDFSGDLYGETISVELLFRLRDEKHFSSETELKSAIERDICMARQYFSEIGV